MRAATLTDFGHCNINPCLQTINKSRNNNILIKVLNKLWTLSLTFINCIFSKRLRSNFSVYRILVWNVYIITKFFFQTFLVWFYLLVFEFWDKLKSCIVHNCLIVATLQNALVFVSKTDLRIKYEHLFFSAMINCAQIYTVWVPQFSITEGNWTYFGIRAISRAG